MTRFLQLIALVLLLPCSVPAASDEAHQNAAGLREEMWAIPSTIPMLAYVIRPTGAGPFPLLVMNQPMLWIYTHNDSYFGPDLSKRLAAAFQASGGIVEYHLLPDFGEDGHFLIDSPDAVKLWSPLVGNSWTIIDNAQPAFVEGIRPCIFTPSNHSIVREDGAPLRHHSLR